MACTYMSKHPASTVARVTSSLPVLRMVLEGVSHSTMAQCSRMTRYMKPEYTVLFNRLRRVCFTAGVPA